MFKVILDTNVLVSALLKENSLPAFIVALIRKKKIRLCISKEIVEEYEEVLKREKFHGIKSEVAPLLTSLRKGSILVEPKGKINDAVDPDDNNFLECAMEAKADFLITGNKKHFPHRSFHHTHIVSPKDFIDDALKFIILNTAVKQ